MRSRNGPKQNYTRPSTRHEVQESQGMIKPCFIYFNGLAIRLQFGIIDCLTGHLLDSAFHFFRRFGDLVLPDDYFLQDQAKAPERAT